MKKFTVSSKLKMPVKRNPGKRKLRQVKVSHCVKNPRIRSLAPKTRGELQQVGLDYLRHKNVSHGLDVGHVWDIYKDKKIFVGPHKDAQRFLLHEFYKREKATHGYRPIKRNPSRTMKPAKRYGRIAKSQIKISKSVLRQRKQENVNAPFKVQVMKGNNWKSLGAFWDKQIATDYGRALAKRYPRHKFRIYWK